MVRKSLSVYDVGSEVTFGPGLKGHVTRISILSSKVLYEIVWWDDKTRKCEWLEEFEVESVDDECRSTVEFK